MKLRTLFLTLFCALSFTGWSQTGLVAGELSVTTFPTNNGNGTFSLVGNFSDPKGSSFASDVTAGMSLWKGNNYFAITVASANGSELTLTVEDTYSIGFLGTGVYSVGEVTSKLGLPAVSSTGDSNASLATPPDYAAKLNFILQLIDKGISGATQGTTLADTTTIVNPGDGEILIAGDTLSIYDDSEWVNLILGGDGQLGTDDQPLTADRTVDFDGNTLTFDLTDAPLDEIAHPILAPDGEILGLYVSDGDGDVAFIVNSVMSSTYRQMISNNRSGQVTVGNPLDSTYIKGDKVFIAPENVVTDNTIEKVLGVDPVTGEIKEVEKSTIAGKGEKKSSVGVIFGDSTINDRSDDEPGIYRLLLSYADTLRGDTVVNRAQGGARIADQITAWNNDPDQKRYHWAFIQVGLNNLNPGISDSAGVVAEMQSFVDSIRNNGREDIKIFMATMIPVYERLGELYPSSQEASYQLYRGINRAIMNNSIKGVDFVIDSHRPLLGYEVENRRLRPEYDTGDHIHENAAARGIIANEWRKALNEAGFLQQGIPIDEYLTVTDTIDFGGRYLATHKIGYSADTVAMTLFNERDFGKYCFLNISQDTFLISFGGKGIIMPGGDQAAYVSLQPGASEFTILKDTIYWVSTAEYAEVVPPAPATAITFVGVPQNNFEEDGPGEYSATLGTAGFQAYALGDFHVPANTEFSVTIDWSDGLTENRGVMPGLNTTPEPSRWPTYEVGIYYNPASAEYARIVNGTFTAITGLPAPAFGPDDKLEISRDATGTIIAYYDNGTTKTVVYDFGVDNSQFYLNFNLIDDTKILRNPECVGCVAN